MEGSFVKIVLKKLGFEITCTNCVMNYIKCVIFCFNKWKPKWLFVPMRGLRQGTQFPFFIICEVWSSSMLKAEQKGHISGVQVVKGGFWINYLSFVDSLLFCKETV